MEPLGLEEYGQLRAAIAQRGALRVVLFLITLAVWAIVTALVAAFIALPLASLLTLLMLAAGFEAVHQLHIGAERIGRYLYVRYESGIGGPLWEGAIARFGIGHKPSTRPADALFSVIFIIAVLVNMLVATLGATLVELTAIGIAHLMLIARIVMAKRAAAHQRAEDQQRFEDVLK